MRLIPDSLLPELPVVEVLPQLRAALHTASGAVLEAPPGAGKSTIVPLALLGEPWVKGRKLLMLEPRRLAARAVAERMAASLNEKVGQTVGYRMRLDTRVSAQTRIEVVTEGVLVRLLHEDPALEDTALVIFDEFHERNLQSDLGLALLLDARLTLGTDLRLLVMSATLDTDRLVGYLGRVPKVRAAGRTFPVDVRYIGEGLPIMPSDGVDRVVIRSIMRALAETVGDVLVFLPGAAEINRVRRGLSDLNSSVRVLPLHGELPIDEQDAALKPAASALRHVVLATNIAETSLTLPGVRVVIDSGLARQSRFDPATGMSRLDTVRVSRGSADQRAGRAGRVAPGVCYRLWSAGAERSLAAHTAAEIMEADLAALVLDLARWGVTDPDRLAWLDPPPRAMFEVARQLLQDLGALDSAGTLTADGKRLVQWPLHPRLARVLLESERRGCPALGATLAALLSERDPLRSPVRGRDYSVDQDIDVLTRLRILWNNSFDAQLNPGAWRRLAQQAARWRGLLSQGAGDGDSLSSTHRSVLPIEEVAVLLASGFPDRIAQPRSESRGRYLLANGRGAALRMPDALANAPYLIALELDDKDREAMIRLAVALDDSQLERALQDRLQQVTQLQWSSRDEAIVAREEVRLGSLILRSRAIDKIDLDRQAALVVEAICGLGIEVLPWTPVAQQLCARIEIVRTQRIHAEVGWPDFSVQGLQESLQDWLGPWLAGISRRSHFPSIPLLQALRFRLGVERDNLLQRMLPDSLVLPTGTRVAIDYLDELAPVASMRMQEVFGLASTPRLAEGRLPLTFKLLSPAGRPLQVTRDLASFWQNAYSEVRKDMRGRYPKHYWPENPLEAEPTRYTKSRR